MYFQQGTDHLISSDKDRRCQVIAECIMFCRTHSLMPFHLGLAIQMITQFGSRDLVDILFPYGLCISYDALRQFQTSASLHQLESSNENPSYVPQEIIPLSECGHIIHEGDDNIDSNTETIDGKGTFHSMARVVFQLQEKGIPGRNLYIRKQDKRSLSLTTSSDNQSKPYGYSKPTSRPEPAKRQEAYEELTRCKLNVRNLLFIATWGRQNGLCMCCLY